MKYMALASFFFWSAVAMAQNPPPADRIGDALTTKLKGSTFEAELKSGFHFNGKAPNVVIVDQTRVQPKKLAQRKVTFQLPSKDFSAARASLYICDDPESFCVPKQIDLKTELTAVAGTVANSKAMPSTKKKGAKINSHGFYEDELELAGAIAKSENKLVLADISARWCPGCVRLENEVFDTKDFKNASTGLVKVKLDYDRFENLYLKSKYGIWAIPSILILTPDLEEVSRIVDFQPMPVLKAFFEDAAKNPSSMTALKSKAGAGDNQAAEVVGRRLYHAGNYAEAVTYLEQAKSGAIELIDAKVQAARKAADADPSKKKAYQNTLRDAIKAEGGSSRSIVWRGALVETLDDKAKAGIEERKKIAQEGIQVADGLLKNKEQIAEAVKGDLVGEYSGYEDLLIASQRADLVSSAGLGEEEEIKALRQVTEIGRAKNIPAKLAGPSLRYLIFLVAAKEYPEAETRAKA
ncbi:MAG: thioredoxin family protein, partial [Bdellovibrionota bacterium]